MNAHMIAAIIVILAISLFVYKNRKRVRIQKILFPFIYIILFKSDKGLNKMDKVARKWPSTTRFLGYAGIVLGFLGMLLIGFELILNTINLFLKPETAAGIQPVLPFEAKGIFFVPFIYWILTIFIVALVHEFAHGIIARTHKIPLKSTGFAFFCVFIPIIPAAFVEPDEETLRLRKKKEQLSVLAAGSFANILVAFLSLIILLTAIMPLANASFQNQGIQITSITDNSPASIAGMQKGEEIRFIAGNRVNTTQEFKEQLALLKTGEEIKIKTDKEVYNVKLEEKEGKTFVGVGLVQKTIPKKEFVEKYGSFTPKIISTTGTFFGFLFLLNLGIGLFNLLPIIPLDGGRMLGVLLNHRKKGKMLFRYVSLFFLLLIIINLVAGFIM